LKRGRGSACPRRARFRRFRSRRRWDLVMTTAAGNEHPLDGTASSLVSYFRKHCRAGSTSMCSNSSPSARTTPGGECSRGSSGSDARRASETASCALPTHTHPTAHRTSDTTARLCGLISTSDHFPRARGRQGPNAGRFAAKLGFSPRRPSDPPQPLPQGFRVPPHHGKRHRRVADRPASAGTSRTRMQRRERAS
jgi:hypothetical protein